jgi:hypothetical protein
MTDRARLEKALRKAEGELEAARKPTEVKPAAARLQRAKAELKALEQAAQSPAPQITPEMTQAAALALMQHAVLVRPNMDMEQGRELAPEVFRAMLDRLHGTRARQVALAIGMTQQLR